MKRQMRQIVSTMVVALFVFSILPFASTSNNSAELRDAIHMVQLLQHPDKSPHSSFKTIFKNTIISLQTAADINTIFTQQHTQEQDDAQLNVSIRLPYLLTKATEIAEPIKEMRRTAIEPPQQYLSHIISPPFPPPLCS